VSAPRDAALADIARRAVELARTAGAQEAAARINRSREVSVQWRDGKLEQISEATTRALGLQLYVDGRFSGVSTSDLRPDALASFVRNAVVLTRKIEADPFRTLPDPALYQGQAPIDLALEDGGYEAVTAVQRRRLAQELEVAARETRAVATEAIISVTSSVSDALSESVRVHSNGFEGAVRDTQFWMSADVSMKDQDGRIPKDWSYAGTRFFGELPDSVSVGREATVRTAARLGARKLRSAMLPMAVDCRAAERLLDALGVALDGGNLQQKESFLEGKQGKTIGSARLDVEDDPLLPKGLGSRLFDDEGIAARPLPIFKAGVLQSYYIDTYYGKKLKMAPTTGGPSNLRWKLGNKDQTALLADMKDGVLVTRFLGGNSNATTGDFSFGVLGHHIVKGQIAEPIGEMNIAGNHLQLWKRLAAVGNDPFPYSSSRTPTLVFDGVQFAGA
jgi:PmbA protein